MLFICLIYTSGKHACESHFSRVRLFATPWTVARRAPLSMGFSKQEYWNGLPCPPPRDLPDPGVEPGSPALGRFFTTSTTWETHIPASICQSQTPNLSLPTASPRVTRCLFPESVCCLSFQSAIRSDSLLPSFIFVVTVSDLLS